MFENVNEVAIVVSAFLSLAIGSIWYSPLLFGAHWIRSSGLRESDLLGEHRTVVRSTLAALFVNATVLFIVAKLLAVVPTADVSHLMLSFYLTLFTLGIMAYASVWEKRSLVYFGIHAGYTVLIVNIGLVVLAYWPW